MIAEAARGDWAVKHHPCSTCGDVPVIALHHRGRALISTSRAGQRAMTALLAPLSGAIVVAGLGLGLADMYAPSAVTAITFVERDADVIALVADSLSPRATVVHANIWQWAAPSPVDGAVLDIWADRRRQSQREEQQLRRHVQRWVWQHGHIVGWPTNEVTQGGAVWNG